MECKLIVADQLHTDEYRSNGSRNYTQHTKEQETVHVCDSALWPEGHNQILQYGS